MVPFLFHDLPITEDKDTLGMFRHIPFMRNQDDRMALVIEVLEGPQHEVPRFGVEVPRRFVRQDQ
jgi:hypothetical protein